jgi:hypothetical protein
MSTAFHPETDDQTERFLGRDTALRGVRLEQLDARVHSIHPLLRELQVPSGDSHGGPRDEARDEAVEEA